MPNWCSNTLVVISTREHVREIADSLRSDYGVVDFQKIIPIENSENWFQENIDRWGTKWNAQSAQTGTTHIDERNSMWVASFDTAWSPPEPVVDKLASLHPNAWIALHFDERGHGFAGINTYANADSYYYTQEQPFLPHIVVGPHLVSVRHASNEQLVIPLEGLTPELIIRNSYCAVDPYTVDNLIVDTSAAGEPPECFYPFSVADLLAELDGTRDDELTLGWFESEDEYSTLFSSFLTEFNTVNATVTARALFFTLAERNSDHLGSTDWSHQWDETARYRPFSEWLRAWELIQQRGVPLGDAHAMFTQLDWIHASPNEIAHTIVDTMKR
jgi:hypothetical protein